MKSKIILCLSLACMLTTVSPIGTHYDKNSENINSSAITRGFDVAPVRKTVYVNNALVKGDITFVLYLYHNTATNKVVISSIGTSNTLSKLVSLYPGSPNVQILNYSPGPGSHFNCPVNINYQIRVGDTPVANSAVVIY